LLGQDGSPPTQGRCTHNPYTAGQRAYGRNSTGAECCARRRYGESWSVAMDEGNVQGQHIPYQSSPPHLFLTFTKLYLCLFIATLNSCINGYDGSLMGAINEYEQYRSYFGFDLNVGTPTTGIVYAIYTIGNLVGSFVAGPATDFRGRKWGIMIGTCVQATCTNLGGFMGGRFVLGFGVAITSTAGPAYVSEMAHPVYRGVCTGVFNTFWYVGGIPGSFVPFGTQNIAGSQSWRIPLWLQMVFAGTVLVCCPFLPETPRWLIANDRHEEALDTMAKFHGEGSRHSPIVMLEYKEMVEDISVTGSDKRWWDYRVRTSTPLFYI
jgi:MFS family permease